MEGERGPHPYYTTHRKEDINENTSKKVLKSTKWERLIIPYGYERLLYRSDIIINKRAITTAWSWSEEKASDKLQN